MTRSERLSLAPTPSRLTYFMHRNICTHHADRQFSKEDSCVLEPQQSSGYTDTTFGRSEISQRFWLNAWARKKVLADEKKPCWLAISLAHGYTVIERYLFLARIPPKRFVGNLSQDSGEITRAMKEARRVLHRVVLFDPAWWSGPDRCCSKCDNPSPK